MKRLNSEWVRWLVLVCAAFFAAKMSLWSAREMAITGSRPVAMFYVPPSVFALPFMLFGSGLIFYAIPVWPMDARISKEESERALLLVGHLRRGSIMCGTLAFMMAFTALPRLTFAEIGTAIARFFVETYHYWIR